MREKRLQIYNSDKLNYLQYTCKSQLVQILADLPIPIRNNIISVMFAQHRLDVDSKYRIYISMLPGQRKRRCRRGYMLCCIHKTSLMFSWSCSFRRVLFAQARQLSCLAPCRYLFLFRKCRTGQYFHLIFKSLFLILRNKHLKNIMKCNIIAKSETSILHDLVYMYVG